MVVQEEVKKVVLNEDGEEEKQEENEEDTKEVKFNPLDYEWSLSDGRSKDVLKVYTKLQESNLVE